MNDKIKANHEITVPPRLVIVLEQLILDYARLHGEKPADCKRAVEIVIVQFGVRALRKELDANAELGVKMGWREKEEEEA